MPKLTNITLAKLKPRKTRYEIPDSGCQNLVLIIQPSGIMSWALRFRFKVTEDAKGEAIKYTIGRYSPLAKGVSKDPRVGDVLSISDAHLLAGEILHDAKRGIDPRKRAVKQAENNFGAVARSYFINVCGMVESADGKVTFNRA